MKVSAVRDGRVISSGQVTAQFWAPGRDPEHDPEARQDPDHAAPCAYDPRTRRWSALVSTAGWLPGTWTVRGLVEEDVAGSAWGTFPLAG